MSTTEPRPAALRPELSRPSRPRSYERLTRVGHRAFDGQPPAVPSARGHAAAASHLRIADLFAGIGGFHLAFGQVGARCVFACENNPTARRVYEANFAGESPELFTSGNFAGDITTIEPDAVPDHDVLTAGFPCQPFSIVGKHRGFQDGRGMYFFDVARILKAKRPAAFFLENVKGLLRHDDGRTFDVIRTVLCDDLGYSLHAKVVRACDFGLPQLRPRLFMVGFREPTTAFRFPAPLPLATTLSDVLGGHCERTVSRTLLAGAYTQSHDSKYNWARYTVDRNVRLLTVPEAMALQGLPRDFAMPASYRASMRLIGNSVAIPAVAATAREIARSLGFLTRPHTPNTDEETRQ